MKNTAISKQYQDVYNLIESILITKVADWNGLTILEQYKICCEMLPYMDYTNVPHLMTGRKLLIDITAQLRNLNFMDPNGGTIKGIRVQVVHDVYETFKSTIDYLIDHVNYDLLNVQPQHAVG